MPPCGLPMLSKGMTDGARFKFNRSPDVFAHALVNSILQFLSFFHHGFSGRIEFLVQLA